MFFLLKLAVLNVFRNMRRTLLTMTTIAVGILGFIMASGMVNGVEQSFIRNDISTETGHVRVFKKGYLKEEENFPLDIQVQNMKKAIAAVQQVSPKAQFLPRIVFSAKLGDGVHSLRIRVIGVDSKKFEAMYGFSKRSTKQKRLPDSGMVMFVGADLAKVFKKKPGDSLTLETRTRAGSFNVEDFQIADVLNTSNTQINAFTVYLPLPTARNLVQMKKGFTDFIVMLPSRSTKASSAAAAAIRKATPANRPHTWQEKAQDIIQLNSVRRKTFNFMIGMILLIAAAGIANTILMSGFERKGEIGMMLAMGMPSRKIITLFALEAAFIGLFGSILGGLLGVSGSLYFQEHGIDLTASTQMMDGTASTIAYATTLYFELYPWVPVVGMFLGMMIAVIAALYPAYKVTQLEPREILAGG